MVNRLWKLRSKWNETQWKRKVMPRSDSTQSRVCEKIGSVHKDRTQAWAYPRSYWALITPVATATFSPKGRWGDLISPGSTAVEANKSDDAVTIGLMAVGNVGVAGAATLPFSFRGIGAWGSDTEFDDLWRTSWKRMRSRFLRCKENANRRFLFGMSGDVLFDLPDPFMMQINLL